MKRSTMGVLGAVALTVTAGSSVRAKGAIPSAPAAGKDAVGAVLGCRSTSGNYPWGAAAFRTWTPIGDAAREKPYEQAGQATGAPFDARLIQAYGEDAPVGAHGEGGMVRMAEFEMRDGCRRRFRVDSLAPTDRRMIDEAMALHPLSPDADTATYSVAFDGQATQAALDAGTLGKFETRHFVFWYGMNTNAAGYSQLREIGLDWQTVLKRWGDLMERAWTWNQQLLKAPMPFAGRTDRKKLNIYLCGTGLPFSEPDFLIGDDTEQCPSRTYDVAFMAPVAVLWPFVPTHEFVHLIEYHTGGMRSEKTHGIWETFAEWDVYSLGRSTAGFLSLSSNNFENGPFWATYYGPYGSYPFITFLWDQDRTRGLVWRPWTDGLRNQDGSPAENYVQAFVRLGRMAGLYPDGFRSFADDMGWYGARLAAMDFVPQREMLDVVMLSPTRSNTLSRTTALAADAGPGAWRSPPERPLRTFGTHLVPLTATGGPVRVTLTGDTKASEAAWRFSIVAVRGDTDVSYSALGRASGKGSGTVSRPVPADARLYLAVTATPGVYEANRPQGPGPVQGTAFPYRVNITGAVPARGPVDPCAGDPPPWAFHANYNTNGNDPVGKPCPKR